MGYQTAEAMVVRKGFSVEQLRECLEEYADLSVVQVRRLELRLAPFSVFFLVWRCTPSTFTLLLCIQ